MKLLSILPLLLLAIPVEAAEPLPRRGALGLGMRPLSSAEAAQAKLPTGSGAVALKPLAGSTAEKAGVQEGDILVEINGKKLAKGNAAAIVRDIPAGAPLAIGVLRDQKPVELKSTLLEKPRDPGTANYEVIYSHIVSHGKRMRTIITKPKAAGKHPGFMFIQGFSPVSYDFTLEGSNGSVTSLDGPILYHFANSGFVTIRVEKPGVGDSEGGPFAEMDYMTELDIYRQTLAQLKQTAGVDTENIFIFGHSMGGAFGPMIASESPVKGLVVYGVAARTWYEYLLDTIRYQGLVGGASFENADDEVRRGAQLMALVFLENMSIDDVKKTHPKLADAADAYFPGGLFNGKSLDFWRQLNQINFAAFWAKCNAHVLAVKGEADFVVYEADHKLIADIVNKQHPGWGTYKLLPGSDHLFHQFPTEQESMKNFQKGQFNPAFNQLAGDWLKSLISPGK